MVLEDLLRRSRELTRYRRPPLGLELDGFCQWLHEQGYSRSVIRSHLSNISQFNQYLRYLGIKGMGSNLLLTNSPLDIFYSSSKPVVCLHL